MSFNLILNSPKILKLSIAWPKGGVKQAADFMSPAKNEK